LQGFPWSFIDSIDLLSLEGETRPRALVTEQRYYLDEHASQKLIRNEVLHYKKH